MAYTEIDNSEEHFQILHYTGDGSTSAGKTRTFSGTVDLKPGIMYQHKYAGGGNYHNIMECEFPKGPGWHWLSSSVDAKNDGITASFDTNGFTHATQNLGGYYHNENGKSYGVWAWSETGASNVTNTDGGITSTVRAHPDAGWSIVNWTGTSENDTIGHGLGVIPEALWMYPIQVAANNGNTQRPQWWSANSYNHVINTGLNESRTESDSTNGRLGAWAANSQGTSSVFSVFSGNSSYEAVNHSSQDYMCIAWRSVKGFSKFGKYRGNNDSDGPTVYTGFKPALVILKRMGGNNDFRCFDNARDPINLDGGHGSINLTANYGAELQDANTKIDFLSNGFKLRTTGAQINGAADYTFGAFAENPFVTSTGVPCTAR
mgnify:FL=1